jgi:redox-sensitive bicupin YhaK (pirin superfamily)
MANQVLNANSPHRGQETITYLLEGGIDHEDFAGNSGTIGPGDLQFMTAGRGIMHAEMPRQNPDGSANVGLQLWVDLPQALKSCEPRYRDLRAGEIPQATVDDGKVSVKVISGQSHGIDSVKDLAYTPVWILDMTMKPGAKVTQPLPTDWNAFAYAIEGEAYFGEGITRTKVEKFHNVVFEQAGQHVHVEVDPAATEDARFGKCFFTNTAAAFSPAPYTTSESANGHIFSRHVVLIAGMPLVQPIIQYGPFVVSSKEDVYQALMDYQTFSNGFERGKDWQSEIGKSMMH